MLFNVIRHPSVGATKTLGILVCAVVLVTLTGCGESGPAMGTVTGKVTYSDGTFPTEKLGVVRFEVAKDTTAEVRKAASGYIQSDGSYELTTIKPEDGAFYGKYKVVFSIIKSYRDMTSLVAEQYTDSETTPYECVIDSSSHTFDFEIEKAQ